MSTKGAGKKAWETRRRNLLAERAKLSRGLDTKEKFIEAFYNSPMSVSPALSNEQIRWAHSHAIAGLFGFCVATGFKYNSLAAIENSTDRLWIADESKSPKQLFRLFVFSTFEHVFTPCQESYEALSLNIVGKDDINRYLRSACASWRFRWLNGDIQDVLEYLTDTGIYDILSSGMQHTPFSLVREVVDSIPNKMWVGNKVFDPACGFGSFLLAAKIKLTQENYLTGGDILHSLVGFDTCPRRGYIAAALLDPNRCARPRIFVANTIKEFRRKGMARELRGCIVLGIFPFQAPKEKTGTMTKDLTKAFVELSLAIKPAIMGVVLPEISAPKRGAMRKALLKSGIKNYRLLGREAFENIGVDTCYVVCLPGHEGETEIIDPLGNKAMLDLGEDFLKSGVPKDMRILPLLAKVSREATLFSRWTDQGGIHTTGPGRLRELTPVEPGSPNSLEVVLTPVDVRWFNVDDLKAAEKADYKPSAVPNMYAGQGDHKVIMSQAGTPGKIGNLLVATDEQVCSWTARYFKVASTEEAVNLKSYLETKLVRALLACVKTCPTNTKIVFQQIPEVDLSVSWTDDLVNEHFQLSPEEILLVAEISEKAK